MTQLQATLELARRGRQEILPLLGERLDEHPEIWQHYGQLAELTERVWLGLITGKDLLFRESMVRRLQALRRELGAPGADPLEKLLIERIVASWLQVQQADIAEASNMAEDDFKTAQLRMKRSDAAHKRFLASTKMLATVRRLAAGIRIEVKHTESGEAQFAGVAAASGSAVADRLRDALAAERKFEEAGV